jgi:hypothetical protein
VAAVVSVIMSDVKRRKVGNGAFQKKREVLESSPPAAPSSESSDAPSDEEASATLDGNAQEESNHQPKTFKELVCIACARKVSTMSSAN